MIWCAWRLDKKDKVICSWNDGNDKNGLMRQGLNELVNKGVVSVRVESPAYDLTLQFENELSLKIFCDQTNPEEDDENYTFFVKDFTYTVELKGSITKAGRSIREASLP